MRLGRIGQISGQKPNNPLESCSEIDISAPKTQLEMSSPKWSWAWICANSQKVCPVLILNYTGETEGKSYEQLASVYRILRAASKHVYNLEEGIGFLNRLQDEVTTS